MLSKPRVLWLNSNEVDDTMVNIMQVENTMRWRLAKDKDGNQVFDDLGNPLRESNSRMIKWSDGRLDLF